MEMVSKLTGRRLFAAIRAAILVGLASIATSAAGEIWFAPTDHIPRNGVIYIADFMGLFSEGAPWQRALSRVEVWELSPRFPLAATADEMIKALSFFKRHHIQLAVGMQMVGVTNCGKGVEGMTNPAEPGAVARRIKEFGGDLRYVGMDEPWWYGHQDKRPVACHLSTLEVAQRVAESVRQVRAVFPGVKFVDVEPVGAIPGDNWLIEVEEWLDAYERSVGEPLSSLQDDMQWTRSWQERTPIVQQLLKTRGIKYGVMFNAGGSQESDAAWIEKAKQNIIAYRKAVHVAPDQACIVSWNIHPSKALPETDSGTLAYLVNWYFETQ